MRVDGRAGAYIALHATHCIEEEAASQRTASEHSPAGLPSVVQVGALQNTGVRETSFLCIPLSNNGTLIIADTGSVPLLRCGSQLSEAALLENGGSMPVAARPCSGAHWLPANQPPALGCEQIHQELGSSRL